MKDIKNLKSFKGNKDGSDWDLRPVDETRPVSEITKMKPDEVNVMMKIRPAHKVDPKTGKRLFLKKKKIFKV